MIYTHIPDRCLLHRPPLSRAFEAPGTGALLWSLLSVSSTVWLSQTCTAMKNARPPHTREWPYLWNFASERRKRLGSPMGATFAALGQYALLQHAVEHLFMYFSFAYLLEPPVTTEKMLMRAATRGHQSVVDTIVELVEIDVDVLDAATRLCQEARERKMPRLTIPRLTEVHLLCTNFGPLEYTRTGRDEEQRAAIVDRALNANLPRLSPRARARTAQGERQG